MPTATSAAYVRPTKSHKPRFGLITASGLAIATALTIGIGSADAPIAAASAASCARHTSTARPPSAIRVLRVHSGRIERVPFRKYVVTVMGKEWPSYLPQPVIEAGAVAVKQYAWYHAIHSRRANSRGCYDVKDSTSDQLYKPGRSRIGADHYSAVNKTWNVTLRKDGRFFMTGYRAGAKVGCGKDTTGYKLYARSAIQCANKGYGYQQILRTYYGPRLDLVGGGGMSSARASDIYSSDTRRASDATRSRDDARPVTTSSARRTPRTAHEAHAQVRQPVVERSAYAGGLTGGIGAIIDRRGTEVF